MTKLIIILLVVTSTFQMYLADTSNFADDTEDETQSQDEESDQWSSSSVSSSSSFSSSSSSSSSSSTSTSSSRSSSSQSQTEDCGPPKFPKCKNPNEVFDSCDTPCPARRCDFDPTVVLCKVAPKEGDKDCVVGCRCIDGYLRNSTGVCIPRDKCPPKQPQCGINEVYDPCPDCSPQTCETMNKTYSCPAIPANKTGSGCNPSCRCKKGYYRNKIGECIAASDCLKCTKPHEYFSCGGACDNVCETIKTQNQTHCPIINVQCNKMCYCEKNYARDYKNDCIPIKDCPSKCKNPNEVFDPCDAPCPARRCDFDATVVRCKAPPKVGDEDCLVGCRCIDGYLRNSTGVCIPREKCPPKKPQCGTNEVYDPCPDCSPQTCETMNKTYSCPAIPASKSGPGCNPSCRCKKGYYRNKIGECIAASDCLKCTKRHEYFSCGGACDNVCENIKTQNQSHCPIINVQCNKMCYCEKDYARDYKNDCIPIKDCPSCPANERYDPCPATLCSAQTCDEAGFPLNCTQREEGSPCPGKPGCVCKDGYLRNKKGICIPSYECSSCGNDKNATQGCGVNCNRHCSDLNKEPHSCILICYPNSCDCKTDKNGFKYYYDDNTKMCVLPQDCTPTCKANEVYSDCINGGCDPRNCSQLGYAVPCVKLDPKDCIKGCICAPGYLRAKNGTCIPVKQCPCCEGDPNAESGCGVFCDRCSGPIPCPKICKVNACQCKKDHVYDDNTKKCVLPKDCTPTCGSNEVFDPCPDCSPQTCETMNKTYHCPLIPANKTGSGCNPSCRCKEGYFRNKIGQCIAASDCLKCPKPHEYYSCGGACDNVCDNIKVQNQSSCPIINIVCNKMCYCEKDYARDYKNDCIPIKDCPTCPVNERYDPCPATLCSPKSCDEAGFPLNCTQRKEGSPCPGKPGCVCKDGYLRNKKGKCVPSYECPSCGNDKNATLGCGVNCNRHCSDLNLKEPQACIEICYPNSCDCRTEKDGTKYYYDDNTKKCVLAQDCSKCKSGEEYSQCANGVCRPQNCTQYGQPIPYCPAFPSDKCRPGCICLNKYLRNKEGVCIPQEQCPEALACDYKEPSYCDDEEPSCEGEK